MKKYSAILVILFLLSYCNVPEGASELNSNPASLAGTWELVSYIPNGDSSWTQYDHNIIYRKVVTNSHFTWLNYDVNTDALTTTGGGTYSYDGNQYIENIEFFYPPGSSALGQAIPFSVSFKNGEWHHEGFAKETEFDIETGNTVVVDSSKIDEIWRKVD